MGAVLFREIKHFLQYTIYCKSTLSPKYIHVVVVFGSGVRSMHLIVINSHVSHISNLVRKLNFAADTIVTKI